MLEKAVDRLADSTLAIVFICVGHRALNAHVARPEHEPLDVHWLQSLFFPSPLVEETTGIAQFVTRFFSVVEI